VHDNKLATCHVGHALCMEKIEPEEVLAEAARILSGSSAAAGAR
jgi:hypothetical protein